VRIPFRTTGTHATVILEHTPASTTGFVFGTQTTQGLHDMSLVLENALLRAGSLTTLTVTGLLDQGRFLSRTAGMVFPLQWILPTLPIPTRRTSPAIVTGMPAL
jgi:hypothetical protein